jgi:hypothetical protein
MFKSQKQKLQDQQISESERLVSLLAEHESTYTAMMAQYTRIDSECIAMAAQYSAELAAGSPRASATALELRTLRWKRDAIKAAFSRRRDELINQAAAFTESVIRGFIEFCLALSKETLRLGNVETEKVISYVDGSKRFLVRQNADRLAELRERIQAGVQAVRSLRDHPLGRVLDAIEKYKREFAAFDTEELESAEVDEQQLADMRAKPEEPKFAKGMMTNSGYIAINPKDSNKIGQLSDRISNLEKNL